MKTTTILKFSIILFAAMLSVSAAAQNFSRYMASEPQAQQPAVVPPMAHQPMVKDPSANQPVVSVRDYERAQRTINVNAVAYNVKANSHSASSVAPLNAAPARRGGILGGGSATAGNASLGTTVGVNTGITSTNNVAGVSTGSVIAMEDYGGAGYTPGGNGVGVVDEPLGDALIPLLLMLLCYALFRLVRGDVRDEQEMA